MDHLAANCLVLPPGAVAAPVADIHRVVVPVAVVMQPVTDSDADAAEAD
jgi:hypothetical protein